MPSISETLTIFSWLKKGGFSSGYIPYFWKVVFVLAESRRNLKIN